MPRPQIQKTVLTITVLHEPGDKPLLLEGGLDDIKYAIEEGPCVGSLDWVSTETVPTEKVNSELLALGNDGTFFDDIDGEYVF